MTNTFAEFTETMTLVVPDVTERVASFMENASAVGEHGLIIEMAAIHAGLTSNFNNYAANELEASLESWVSPYPKPILINHDLMTDPLGRVMAAKMDKENDNTPFVRLQIAVTDPQAIARVASKRYLTGSVGGRSEEAICSVCGSNWAEASAVALPCKHTRGKTYKGKLAYLDRKQLGFKEYSFVNAPADSRSSVREPVRTDDQSADEWVRPARIFDLNMHKEEILEYAESESLSVLSGLKRKEATPLYLQLKGAFLTALSAHEANLGVNSKEMSDVTVETETSDLADVLEALEDDLATAAAPAPEEAPEAGEEAPAEEAPAEEAPEEPAAEEEPAVEEPAVEEPGEEAEPEASVGDEEPAVEEPAEESAPDRAEGQESPRDPHASNDKGTQHQGDRTRDSADAPTNLQEGSSSTGLKAIEILERRVEELETSEATLLGENARLKKALHRTLAERVVDTKIALRVSSVEERASEIEEHMSRTAASLADSLRDLSKLSFENSRIDPTEVPAIDNKGLALESGDAVTTEWPVEENHKDEVDPESIFVDVLMGRRPL